MAILAVAEQRGARDETGLHRHNYCSEFISICRISCLSRLAAEPAWQADCVAAAIDRMSQDIEGRSVKHAKRHGKDARAAGKQKKARPVLETAPRPAAPAVADNGQCKVPPTPSCDLFIAPMRYLYCILGACVATVGLWMLAVAEAAV